MKKLLVFLSFVFFANLSNAENVRIYEVVIPFSAGGPSDVLFRAIQPELNQKLIGSNIRLVVKNTPGAGGSIGLSEVINNKDLTFGFFSPFFAINKTIKNDVVYDYDSVNFLSFAGYNKMVIISGTHNNLKSLKEYCKNKTITFGSSGLGSTSHLSAYYFATKHLNCKEVISIPYKGVSMVYPDLKAGRLTFMADFAISVNNFLESGYFNHIVDLTENDLSSWHIFVSNKIENKDSELVKKAFETVKADKLFTKSLENKFNIYKFSENKDTNWLQTQFNMYKIVIQSLPKL